MGLILLPESDDNMKVAKEKVWADADGNLVPDGDAGAAVLVAAKGQSLIDARLSEYKGVDKFFKDARFDADGNQVQDEPKKVAPVKADMDAPKPQNREADLKLRKRKK